MIFLPGYSGMGLSYQDCSGTSKQGQHPNWCCSCSNNWLMFNSYYFEIYNKTGK